MAYQPRDGDSAEKGGPTQQPWGKNPPKKVFKLQDWMSDLDDFIPVSALSIPATHDSCAYTTTWPFISTQNMDIHSQLYAGIRYFDFRCGAINDTLEMVHGTAKLGLLLSEVLETIYAYLSSHPREAIIIQLKKDRKDDTSTRDFASLVDETLAPNAQYWRTSSTTPTLGELRGRIQLLRRFTGQGIHGFGIDVSRWQDNPPLPFTIHTWQGVHLTIQDHYSFSSPETLPNVVAKKGGNVAEMLARSVQDPEDWHWYINFSSAFEFNVYHQINPRQIALGGYHYFKWVEGINLRLYNSLAAAGRGKRRLGVVVMDFPELPVKDLIQVVVESNFEVEDSRVDHWWWWWMVCLLDLLLFVLVLVFGLMYAGLARPEGDIARLLVPSWLTDLFG